jgi:predicted TIM-barrel fold metal-dependent hydrolase
MSEVKIWANSGDSHSLGERAVWDEILPKHIAERMPRSERHDEEGYEIVHIDGHQFRRELPKLTVKRDPVHGKTIGELVSERGAGDIVSRLRDCDEEGIWGEIVYDSLGLWESTIKDVELLKTANRAQNEWKVSEIVSRSNNRLVPTASIPLLDVGLAIVELQHAASIGLRAVSMPTGVPEGLPDYNRDDWEPLWAAADEANMVLAFHIGSDNDGNDNTKFRGPGGAVLNYVNTTFGGQFVALKLVTSGALDRHPNLRVLISEGGASWVPFIGDRMNEGYRQHSMFVRPVLSMLPKEILYRQVYTSFQHDETAPAAMWAMGYRNLMWGSDYPHLEGTFGHSQKTLHELFDGVAPEVSQRIRLDAFKELFPQVGDPPTA